MLRHWLAPAAVAAAAVYVAWLGFGPQDTHDYGRDFAPAMNALLAGHVHAFFALLPGDGAGGSIVLRLPGALLGKLLVGTQLAIFRFGALECGLVLGGLGLYLARRLREAGRPLIERFAAAALCVLLPLILDAIVYGHPEEPLGGALAVASVLLAGQGRSGAAGLCLGLAVLDKPWGILAAAPALLAVSSGGRLRLVAAAVAPLAAWGVAELAIAPGEVVHQFGLGDPVAHPQDLWWPLSHRVVLPGGVPYHFAPRFLILHGRVLAVIVPLLAAIPLALRKRRSTTECLALLALCFGLRCALDSSNHVYYEVPFVIALVACQAEAGQAPVAGLLSAGAMFLAFHTVAAGSLTLQFWFYVLVTVGLAALVIGPATGAGRRQLPSIGDDRA